MPQLPDLLVQIASRHAVYLEGLKTGYAGEFERFLKDMEADILAQLRRIDNPESLTGQRLDQLLRAIRRTLDSGFNDYERVFREQLAELAEYESGFAARAINQVADVQMILPSPAQLITAAFSQPLGVKGTDGGKLLEPFFRDWTDKTKDRITGAIRLAAAQGQSTPDLVRRIRGTRAARYQDGLIQATRRDVTLMARTAYQHVVSQARAETYRQNEDIVKAEEFVAVLDGRTSVQCRSLSGRRFKVGKGPMPPLHMACRSVRVPVLRDGLDLLREGGEQFSRGADGIKRVDADLTYFDWLKTQPSGFQDSVIGPERGRLLRDGGLTAERFAQLQLDKNFRPRTLDEIRALEPLAFERAGM